MGRATPSTLPSKSSRTYLVLQWAQMVYNAKGALKMGNELIYMIFTHTQRPLKQPGNHSAAVRLGFQKQPSLGPSLRSVALAVSPQGSDSTSLGLQSLMHDTCNLEEKFPKFLTHISALCFYEGWGSNPAPHVCYDGSVPELHPQPLPRFTNNIDVAVDYICTVARGHVYSVGSIPRSGISPSEEKCIVNFYRDCPVPFKQTVRFTSPSASCVRQGTWF
ncbi:uncharacterized protein LOC117284129 [Fukomys damarensis]|uniref:uncharacterized protein LOC117284129 n=1 Tax=Fukomys damarensis TaxID=885580 RepID=UPI0014557CB4|nr:uncharacterized protein LOC117284129 [Fukomys damarensis]